jgi:hypothetical protein
MGDWRHYAAFGSYLFPTWFLLVSYSVPTWFLLRFLALMAASKIGPLNLKTNIAR